MMLVPKEIRIFVPAIRRIAHIFCNESTFTIQPKVLSPQSHIKSITKIFRIMSKEEKEKKAQEFWEYYLPTQGSIIILDPSVLD